MVSPTSSNINKNSNISVDSSEGFICITSVIKDTDMTIGGIAIPDTVKAQEFYSPIKCLSFSASPLSVIYKIVN
jgi:hypothetical protein